MYTFFTIFFFVKILSILLTIQTSIANLCFIYPKHRWRKIYDHYYQQPPSSSHRHPSIIYIPFTYHFPTEPLLDSWIRNVASLSSKPAKSISVCLWIDSVQSEPGYGCYMMTFLLVLCWTQLPFSVSFPLYYAQ